MLKMKVDPDELLKTKELSCFTVILLKVNNLACILCVVDGGFMVKFRPSPWQSQMQGRANSGPAFQPFDFFRFPLRRTGAGGGSGGQHGAGHSRGHSTADTGGQSDGSSFTQ